MNNKLNERSVVNVMIAIKDCMMYENEIKFQLFLTNNNDLNEGMPLL